MTRAEAPRFSVTLTFAGTPTGTSSADQRRYSGRAPQITSRPSGWVRPSGNGTVPCPTGTAPSAIVVVTRFIGEEPMNEATNVFAGRPNTSCGVPTCCSRPAFITASRSASASASAWSWVTNTVVTPRSRCSSLRKVRASRRSRASRLDSGSSSSRISGRSTSARAIATRCCCPPERSARFLPSCAGERSTCSAISRTFRSTSARGSLRTLSPKAMFSRTSSEGNSA